MDDYVIGIRLALDNGVSAGLASIRADLATLDKSVAASAEGLRSLTQSASAAPLPLDKAAAKTDQPALSPTQDAAPTVAAAMRLTSQPDQSPRPVRQVRIDPPAATSIPIPPATPVAAPISANASVAYPAPVSTATAPVQGGEQTPPRHLQTPTAAPIAFAPASGSSQPAAAFSASSNPAQPSFSSGSTSYAPPPAQHAAGTTNGNVYLDGERMGHWVANHLSREANRPSYGPSGFDPSLSIAWPGAGQGGS
jgi:hypothetical protein